MSIGGDSVAIKTLTVKNIREAQPGDVLKDEGTRDAVPGLQLRVFPARSAFYLYYRTLAGAQRKPKLGDLSSAFTLDAARKKAREMLAEVQEGGDPSHSKRERRRAQTLQDVFDACWAEHWNTERYIRSGWAKQVKSDWELHLKAEFGQYALDALKAKTITAWFKDFKPIYSNKKGVSGQATANRCLNILSRLYTYAAGEEWVTPGFNPCAAVKRHPIKKRKKMATKEQLVEIGKSIERHRPDHPEGAAFLRILLLTGIRPRALERATREQYEEFTHPIDGRTYGRLVYFGKSTADTDEEEVTIFPPEAVEEVRALPVPEDGSLIGCKMPKRLWNKIRDDVGCHDLWARDSRRTFASIALDNDVELSVIGRALNHHNTQTTLIYAHLLMDKRAKVAATVGKEMAELLGKGGEQEKGG